MVDQGSLERAVEFLFFERAKMKSPSLLALCVLVFVVQALAKEWFFEWEMDNPILNPGPDGRWKHANRIGGSIPGPCVNVTVGDILTFQVKNVGDYNVTIHWYKRVMHSLFTESIGTVLTKSIQMKWTVWKESRNVAFPLELLLRTSSKPIPLVQCGITLTLECNTRMAPTGL